MGIRRSILRFSTTLRTSGAAAILALATCVCFGCGNSGSGGPDAGEELPLCTTPITGDGPFGVSLGGTAALYFPEGRHPLKPVIFAAPSTELDPINTHVSRAYVKNLDVAKISMGVFPGFNSGLTSYDGTLRPPPEGLLTTITQEITDGDMIIGTETRTYRFCSQGPIPDLAVTAVGNIGPLSEIGIHTNAPLMEETRTISIDVGGSAMDAELSTSGLVANIRPLGVLPPNQPISIGDVTVTDILGRTTSVASNFTILKTVGTVADLTFETWPEQAVTPQPPEGGGGYIAYYAAPPWNRVETLIALPSVAGKSTATVTWKNSTGDHCNSVRVAAIDVQGTANIVEIDTRSQKLGPQTTVSLPGNGENWLLITADGGPIASGPPWFCDVYIDDIILN